MTRNKWAERWLCGVGEPLSDLERTPRTGGVRRTRTRKQRCNERSVVRSSNADLRERSPRYERSSNLLRIRFWLFSKFSSSSFAIGTQRADTFQLEMWTAGIFLSQRRVSRPTLFRWTLYQPLQLRHNVTPPQVIDMSLSVSSEMLFRLTV